MLIIFELGLATVSVLDMIHAFENVIRRPIPHEIFDRRQGDVKISFADASKSYKDINWFTQKGIYEIGYEKELHLRT